MSTEQEVQFHGALLCCGKPPGRIRDCLDFDDRRTMNSYDYTAFKLYKSRLLHHLVDADYFDIYYSGYEKVHEDHKVLTERCALWVGDFFRWWLAQQENASE